MEVTEVKIQLKEASNKKLKAYATVTFDNQFVVRFVKVIQGNQGLFIAMPARKVRIFCPRCGKKVEMRSRYCNWCGIQLPPPPKDFDKTSAQQQHQDIAHPINQQFRQYLQEKVLEAYKRELESQKSLGGESKPASSSVGETPIPTAEEKKADSSDISSGPDIDLSKLDF